MLTVGNTEKMSFPIELTTIACGECGGIYAIGERYRRQKHEEGGGWNCPYCKIDWGYFNNSENAKLKRELEAAQRREQSAKDDVAFEQKRRRETERKLIAAKGQRTKLKKRIAAGMCPCCRRPFSNLMSHMKHEHPDFVQTETA